MFVRGTLKFQSLDPSSYRVQCAHIKPKSSTPKFEPQELVHYGEEPAYPPEEKGGPAQLSSAGRSYGLGWGFVRVLSSRVPVI